MKRLLIFLSFFVIKLCCNAQSRVTIIASVHNSTKYITQDTLLKALANYKPEIILMELDTSLMDINGNFKREVKTMSLESIAADQYQKSYKNVQLRAIDVPDRNKYYSTHKTFDNEARMGKAIDSLYKGNMLNDTTWFIVNSLYSATQILNNFTYMKLQDINSDKFMEAASLRQYLLYKREVDIIHNNIALHDWYSFAKEDADFWDLRSQTMINNILKFTKQFPGKKIAVIVGAFHKYALVEGLKSLTKSNDFILVDDWIK